MGLHGGYGNNVLADIAGLNKGKRSQKCVSCGAKFFEGSRMSRLHIIDSNGIVICKRAVSMESICKINQCGGLILPSKIIKGEFQCNRCSLTFIQSDGVFIR